MEREDRCRHIRLELDPKASPEAVALFEKMETGSEMSAYELATALAECDKGRTMPRALFAFIVELYKEAIEGDNLDAMNDLGALYYNGRGCEQDYKKAVAYYEMAAARGHRCAQENLGYCHYYGRSVPVDYEKAFHYFALGAFEGSTVSLYKIGDMYLNGYYVEKNPVEAFRIYSRCLECLPDELATEAGGSILLRLGDCYLNGLGTMPDPQTALRAYTLAEERLRKQVLAGEKTYETSLQAAIEGKEKAKEKLTATE